MRIISKLEIKDKHLVKGINFEGLRKIGDAFLFAKNFYEQNIDELILIDPVASLYGKQIDYSLVQKVSKNILIPKICGGGIQKIDDIRKLLLVGADMVTMNSAIIKKPKLISDAANIFGSSTITASITTKKINNKFYVYIDNGKVNSGIIVNDWIQQLQSKGIGQIMITSIDKDGTGNGFEDGLNDYLSKKCKVPIIISGGFGKLSHLQFIKKNKFCEAVAISSSFHKFTQKKLPINPEYKNSRDYYELFLNKNIKGFPISKIRNFFKYD